MCESCTYSMAIESLKVFVRPPNESFFIELNLVAFVSSPRAIKVGDKVLLRHEHVEHNFTQRHIF